MLLLLCNLHTHSPNHCAQSLSSAGSSSKDVMLEVTYLGKRLLKGSNVHLVRVKCGTSKIVIFTEGGTKIEKQNFKGEETFAIIDIPKKKGVITVKAGAESHTLETD